MSIGPQMQARAATYSGKSRAGPVTLLASEHVSSFLIALPKSSARQRPALLTFGVEEHIGVPLDSVAVVEGPLKSAAGQTLAFVCSKGVLAEHDAGDRRLLPDFLLIPRPDTADWAVWREGERAVVRLSDGTGFATDADMLALLWDRAGRPSVAAFHDPLPGEMNALDLSSSPPAPDPTDLAFSFGRTRHRQDRSRRVAVFAGAALGVAAALQLGLLGMDAYALNRLADNARDRAQAAIATPLPGVTVTRDIAPVLARLAPAAPQAERGAFLPLVSQVSAVLARHETPLSFRRLAWGAQQNELVVLVQSSGLSDLQTIQQTLEAEGFDVRSGAANASDGGAEAELRIRSGGA